MTYQDNSAMILGIAFAVPSKKYGMSNCVISVTPTGEFVRQYPVLAKHGNIRTGFIYGYKTRANAPNIDARKESIKIDVEVGLCQRSSNYNLYKNLQLPVSTLEKLTERIDVDYSSIGVIIPIIKNIKLKDDGHLEIKFKCKDSPDCKGHTMSIIDDKIRKLGISLLEQGYSKEVVKERLKKELFKYEGKKPWGFLMGTIHRYKYNWTIIGVVPLVISW